MAVSTLQTHHHRLVLVAEAVLGVAETNPAQFLNPPSANVARHLDLMLIGGNFGNRTISALQLHRTSKAPILRAFIPIA